MAHEFDKKAEDSSFISTQEEIQEILEIAAKEEKKIEVIKVKAEISKDSREIDVKKDRDIDYNYARKNLKAVIEVGKTSLEQLEEIAKGTQHPRAYEVLTLLLNSIVVANKKLLELHQDKQLLEIEEKKAADRSDTSNKTVNNNLFVGNSAQLLDFVKNLNKDETTD